MPSAGRRNGANLGRDPALENGDDDMPGGPDASVYENPLQMLSDNDDGSGGFVSPRPSALTQLKNALSPRAGVGASGMYSPMNAMDGMTFDSDIEGPSKPSFPSNSSPIFSTCSSLSLVFGCSNVAC